MVTLDLAKKALHDAETLVAKLTGEAQALAKQVHDAEEALRHLGIDPVRAESSLEALVEEIHLADASMQASSAQLQALLEGTHA